MKQLLAVLTAVVLFAALFVGCVFVFCWSFGIAFSWRYVTGSAAALVLLRFFLFSKRGESE